MRGKDNDAMVFNMVTRITPAYAGKSLAEFGKTSKAWDHPRLCGEKPHTIQVDQSNVWITPAYAGKSMVSGVCSPGLRDHPRLCGEKLEQAHALAYNR